MDDGQRDNLAAIAADSDPGPAPIRQLLSVMPARFDMTGSKHGESPRGHALWPGRQKIQTRSWGQAWMFGSLSFLLSRFPGETFEQAFESRHAFTKIGHVPMQVPQKDKDRGDPSQGDPVRCDAQVVFLSSCSEFGIFGLILQTWSKCPCPFGRIRRLIHDQLCGLARDSFLDELMCPAPQFS